MRSFSGAQGDKIIACVRGSEREQGEEGWDWSKQHGSSNTIWSA